MRTLRAGLLVAGVAAICFGLWEMRDLDREQLVSTAIWLAGGVAVHDFVLSPIVVVLGVAVAAGVPSSWRRPLVVAFVLWGAVTVVALPVLSGMGERPDNPTLLDRPYAVAWWTGTAVVAVCVLAYGWIARRYAVGGR